MDTLSPGVWQKGNENYSACGIRFSLLYYPSGGWFGPLRRESEVRKALGNSYQKWEIKCFLLLIVEYIYNRSCNFPSQRASLIKLSLGTRLNPEAEGGIRHSLPIDIGWLGSFLGARPWVLIHRKWEEEVKRETNEQRPAMREGRLRPGFCL